MNFGLNASRPMGFGKQRQPMTVQKILIVTTNVKGIAHLLAAYLSKASLLTVYGPRRDTSFNRSLS
ncbi:MAG TPA: hypothetical protein DCZ37_04495 [Alteromonas macleodii]|nr:hypothetical protein [Alteromonas macleodii]